MVFMCYLCGCSGVLVCWYRLLIALCAVGSLVFLCWFSSEVFWCLIVWCCLLSAVVGEALCIPCFDFTLYCGFTLECGAALVAFIVLFCICWLYLKG